MLEDKCGDAGNSLIVEFLVFLHRVWDTNLASLVSISNQVFCASSCVELAKLLEEMIVVTLQCDGVALDLANRTPLEGIALLNIPSIHGGSNMWGENTPVKKQRKSPTTPRKGKQGLMEQGSSFSLNSMDLHFAIQGTDPFLPLSSVVATNEFCLTVDIGDKLIEVVGMESAMHAGQVRAGLRSSGRRLSQCSSVVIRSVSSGQHSARSVGTKNALLAKEAVSHAVIIADLVPLEELIVFPSLRSWKRY